MQGSHCPSCGAPADPDARFCAYCGASMPGPSAPLPSSAGIGSTPFPAPGPAMPYGQAPAPPRRRRRWVTIAVILVVIILIVGVVAVTYPASPSPPIQVAFINIYAPDNVCGLNANPIAFYGFNSSTSANQTLDFGMPNYNSTLCTVVGVTTNTSGFALSAIQVPLSIPGNGTGSMNITITPPSSPYSGDMNLVLR